MRRAADVVQRVTRSEDEDAALAQVDLDAPGGDVQELVLRVSERVAELAIRTVERHRVETTLIAVDEHPPLALGVRTARSVVGTDERHGRIAVLGRLAGAGEQLELARPERAGDLLERPDARPGEAALQLAEERMRELGSLRELYEGQAAGMAKSPDAGSDALGLHVRRDVDGGGHLVSITRASPGDERGDAELIRGNDRDTRRKRALRNVGHVERINIPPLPGVVQYIPDPYAGVPVSSLPRPLRVLRNATLADGSFVDVELGSGVVVSTRPAEPDNSTTEIGDDELDLTGYLLLPAPAEPHAHLDKARSWDLIAPPMGDLGLAIASWRAYAQTMTVEDVAARARAQALAMLANGTTAIRSHVDVLVGDRPLRGVLGLVQVREELRDLIDIEIVALPGPDIPDSAIEAALDAGADTLGGAPHIAADPLADLRRLLAIAEKYDVPVDLHTDESLDGAVTLGEYAAITAGWTRNLSAGHCVRLGTLATAERDAVIDAVVQSRIGIIANPITNLYLQGWEHEHSAPRGLTSARALLDAGARFAAGADNVRDPFNPVGRSDALETASLLVTAAHLTLDEAYAAVSTGARDVLGLPVAGTSPGDAAEFLAVRAGSLAEAIADASPERIVIHRGALVARSILTTDVAPSRRGQPRIGVAV